MFEASIVGKWLSMLKEMAPHLARAALVANPKTTPYDYFLRAAEAAAPPLAIELVPSRVENAADIERAVESVAREPDGGLVILPDGTMFQNRDLIIALAARYRLPAKNCKIWVGTKAAISASMFVFQRRTPAGYAPPLWS